MCSPYLLLVNDEALSVMTRSKRLFRLPELRIMTTISAFNACTFALEASIDDLLMQAMNFDIRENCLLENGAAEMFVGVLPSSFSH